MNNSVNYCMLKCSNVKVNVLVQVLVYTDYVRIKNLPAHRDRVVIRHYGKVVDRMREERDVVSSNHRWHLAITLLVQYSCRHVYLLPVGMF